MQVGWTSHAHLFLPRTYASHGTSRMNHWIPDRMHAHVVRSGKASCNVHAATAPVLKTANNKSESEQEKIRTNSNRKIFKI